MSRTWLTAMTALLLVNVSVGMMLFRRWTLGEDIDGPRGRATWEIRLVMAGRAQDPKTPVRLTFALPPDFRRQNVLSESLPRSAKPAQGLKSGYAGQRKAVWTGPLNKRKRFSLSCEFRCVLGCRRPTHAMHNSTRIIDAKPSPREYLHHSPLIESNHKKIRELADSLIREENQDNPFRAFFDFVTNPEEIALLPARSDQSALECLLEEGGDAAGKSRLLIALCRARGIRARLITGLILDHEGTVMPHHWVEAWINKSWVPACPRYQIFDEPEDFRNHLVLHVGDENWLQGENLAALTEITVKNLTNQLGVETGESGIKQMARRFSLYSLNPEEQALVTILLLLPLAALIVSFFRVVIGLPTFGTYGPALLGLAFLDWSALPWGIAAFILVVMVGWNFRRFLDHYRLLMVPRTSTLLTMIVIFLIFLIVLCAQINLPVTGYLGLFPLVILTHVVERFWTVEAEDGTMTSFKALAGTVIVTVVISLSLAPRTITTWFFRYPELLGIVLALNLLLGRYTGYRLSELYRFRDLIREMDEQEAQA